MDLMIFSGVEQTVKCKAAQMRYHETRARSAELLRLALPLMSKQDAGMHPITYAVWYEYVSGMNAKLRDEIDALQHNGQKLNNERTFDLYNKYVVEAFEETAERVRAELNRLLNEVLTSTTATGYKADEFSVSLERLSSGLQPTANAVTLRESVETLLQDTDEIKGSLGTLRQVMSESRAEVEQLRTELQQAREEALTDGLTGLVNRKGFDQAIHTLVGAAQSRSTQLCLALIDIDHFKRVNDSYGHLFGDRVIRVVAQALKASIKGKDTLARYGGEEFAVLLPETTISGAHAVAEQLRKLIECCRIRRIDSEESVGQITISIGMALFIPGEPIAKFINRADEALYQSKAGGRNRVTLAL